MEEKKKKRKWIPIAILIGIIFIIGILISTIFAFANINKNTIVSGVKIEGIDVSGLSAEEAKGKLETIYTEKLETEIPVQYNEYETTINANLFETKYNIEDAVKKAVEIGKEGNIFENNYKILFALIGKQDIKVEMQLNEEAAKKIIEDLGTNLPGVVIESSYYRRQQINNNKRSSRSKNRHRQITRRAKRKAKRNRKNNRLYNNTSNRRAANSNRHRQNTRRNIQRSKRRILHAKSI